MKSTANERELIAYGVRLFRHGRVTPRPEFRAQLRSSLLGAPVAFRSRWSWPRGWSRTLALRPLLLATLVLALLAAVGGGAAAAASLPGDPAFTLKRAAEDVQVALTSDEVARLDTLVAQSERRLVDLETLVARGSAAISTGMDEYSAAVARVDATVTEVAALPASTQRDAALGRASGASADHLARLQALALRVPDAAQRGIQRAIEVQQGVHGKSDRGGSPHGVPVRP